MANQKRPQMGYQQSVSQPKPPTAASFGGPKDGRKLPYAGNPAIPSLSNTKMGTIKGARPVADATQVARRKKDPAAQIRRAARKALGIGDVRSADPGTVKRLQAKGLLPGKSAGARKAKKLQSRAGAVEGVASSGVVSPDRIKKLRQKTRQTVQGASREQKMRTR